MNREKEALQMANKDGRNWEDLNEVMRHAYLHNADGAILDRKAQAVVKAEAEAPHGPVTCPVCKGEGWRGDKPCPECNPVGLREESEVPVALAVSIPITVFEVEKIREDGGIKTTILHDGLSEAKNDNPSDSGAGTDNQPTGSTDTGKPKQPKKPKAKSKARKRSR